MCNPHHTGRLTHRNDLRFWESMNEKTLPGASDASALSQIRFQDRLGAVQVLDRAAHVVLIDGGVRRLMSVGKAHAGVRRDVDIVDHALQLGGERRIRGRQVALQSHGVGVVQFCAPADEPGIVTGGGRRRDLLERTGGLFEMVSGDGLHSRVAAASDGSRDGEVTGAELIGVRSSGGAAVVPLPLTVVSVAHPAGTRKASTMAISTPRPLTATGPACPVAPGMRQGHLPRSHQLRRPPSAERL